MDASEDDDIKLQRKAADFIEDLSQSLKPFLWKTTKSGKTAIRRRVRVRDADRLVNLLEPFQEDPQLLDPHLDKFVPSLADALLAYLRSPTSTLPESNTQLLTPVSHAICRLLYTFCKVRGEKVIVRFFSTETRHLELLLSAIEKGGQQDDGQSASPETAETWDWEERYIVLLWLSQLLLAPFDLASISSEETDDIVQPNIAGLSWPSNTPGLTIRVIPLTLRYLSSSGKERDAAKILLVRIAMRKDMQELGILNALVQWALSSLHSSQVGHSTYYYIGTLSFLAGILVSSEGTTDMTPYLGQISKLIQNVYATEEPVFKAIKSSAIARKTIIKVLRTITVLLIQTPESMPDSDMAIEATIGHLLDSLADLATPVRLAASKALSVVTLKLPEEMAVEVGSAVLEALEKNILFVQKGGKGKARDLSRVNPLEWHGLMLTMAHLLYRHSIPTAQLPPILNALRLGLVFEQRSTSGTSIGTNVRDAACFGIWAMARRYTTNDLQKLQLKDDVFTQGGPLQQSPALQILATELVVSASLDPAGNIRRGSSAALQELIGRHPNTIAEGIRVVQVVDYHAVALRSRAVLEVALQAAELSDEYYQGLLKALLGWRGIQDGDTGPRRVAADAIGKLVLTKQKSKNDTKTGSTWDIVSEAMDLVAERLKGLAAREIEERHGLILSLAAIIENFNYECSKARIAAEIEYGLEYNRHSGKRDIVYIVQTALSHLAWILKEVNSNWSIYRKPGLMAESCSRLLIDICPIIRFDCILRQYESLAVVETQSEVDSTSSRRGPLEGSVTLLQFFGNPSFANKMENADLKMALEFVHIARKAGFSPNAHILGLMGTLIRNILDLNDLDAVDVASTAAADMMLLIDDLNHEQSDLISEFVQCAKSTVKGGRANQGKSYIHTLFKIFPLTTDTATTVSYAGGHIEPRSADLIETFWTRWTEFHEIEIRATILSCLATSSALHTKTNHFIDMIGEGLDDFTTNARGDIGSLVRVEATKAAGAIWADHAVLNDIKMEAFNKLFGKVLRAAAEKLDRVRIEGQKAVASALKSSTSKFTTYSTSSKEYFLFLLELQTSDWLGHGPPPRVEIADWFREVMEGYITSADTGAEELVRASRSALADFCEVGHTASVYDALTRILEKQVVPGPNEDRVINPCLEVINFLFDMGFLQNLKYDLLNSLVKQACSGKKPSIRRLEACIKVWAGLSPLYPPALEQLTVLLLYRYPRIRNAVVDELWVLKGVGKGVDWGKAKRVDVERLGL